MLFSYGLFVFAFSLVSGEETAFAGGVLGIAIGLVPGVFIAAAYVSQNTRSIRAALLATGIWFVVTIPIALVDLPTGLVAGFGFGGIVAFKQRDVHTWKSRAVAVVACVAYTFLLQRVSPEAGLLGGAALPFFAIGIADVLKEREAERADKMGEPV